MRVGGLPATPLPGGAWTARRCDRVLVRLLKMIDATYGHLAQDAEGQERDLLDTYDAANSGCGHAVGTTPAADDPPEESAA